MTTAKKVAMISGANRGIGREISLELSKRGYALSLGMRHPETDSKDLKGTNFRYEARDPGAGRDWVNATLDAFGRIDVLVCSAGICKEISLEEGTDELLEETLDINLKAPFRLTQAALPHLRKSGTGRVIFLSSLSGKRVKNNNAGYQISKHALIALNHAVRRAGWSDGVRSTAICPGFVNTDMAVGMADLAPEAMTQPADVAHIVANAIETPNTASVAEILINCRHEDLF